MVNDNDSIIYSQLSISGGWMDAAGTLSRQSVIETITLLQSRERAAAAAADSRLIVANVIVTAVTGRSVASG